MTDRPARVHRELASALRRFDDEPPTVLSGGNCIVLMTTSCVARGGIVGAVTRFEVDAVREARRLGLPAPDVLDSGPLADSGMYLVYRRLPGSPASSAEPSALPCAMVAAALGTLHVRARPEIFPVRPASLEARAVRAEHALGLAHGGATPGWVAAAIESVVATDGRARIPVHGDIRPDNLLVDDAGRLSGVLDWSDTHLGDREEDIAFFDPECWPALAREYCRSTQVPLDPQRLVGHAAARVLSLAARGVLSPGGVPKWITGAERAVSHWLPSSAASLRRY